MSDNDKRALVLRLLTNRAAAGKPRPWWAERAACIICDTETRMWAAGTIPTPRPM